MSLEQPPIISDDSAGAEIISFADMVERRRMSNELAVAEKDLKERHERTDKLGEIALRRLRDENVIGRTLEIFDQTDQRQIEDIFYLVRVGRDNNHPDSLIYRDLVKVETDNILDSPEGEVITGQNLFVLNYLFDREKEAFSVIE